MIWYSDQTTIESVRGIVNNSMGEHLGIQWKEMGDDYLVATMPVDQRTRQPYGLLHGGASCVLAESIGSVASAMVIDTTKFICVGLEINANHVRGVREGIVTGTAKPLHLGNSTHVWDIRIVDEKDRLICVSRLTVAIIPKRD